MMLRRFILAVAVPIALLSSVTTTSAQMAPTPGALPQERPPDLVTLLKSSDPRQQQIRGRKPLMTAAAAEHVVEKRVAIVAGE